MEGHGNSSLLQLGYFSIEGAMAEYESLIVEKTGAVGTVRLNRPDKHNALNAQLSHELIDALDALEADDGVNVIVLTGAGERAFCAGADMAEAVGGNGPDPSDVGAPAQAVARLLRTAKPIIAAVNGYAYGGGAVLAINCDMRIASENAKFRFVGASYGLVVGAFQLPGIVEVALAIAANSRAAVMASKQVIDAATSNGEALRQEVEANQGLRKSDEHRERFRAAAMRVTGEK